MKKLIPVDEDSGAITQALLREHLNIDEMSRLMLKVHMDLIDNRGEFELVHINTIAQLKRKYPKYKMQPRLSFTHPRTPRIYRFDLGGYIVEFKIYLWQDISTKEMWLDILQQEGVIES